MSPGKQRSIADILKREAGRAAELSFEDTVRRRIKKLSVGVLSSSEVELALMNVQLYRPIIHGAELLRGRIPKGLQNLLDLGPVVFRTKAPQDMWIIHRSGSCESSGHSLWLPEEAAFVWLLNATRKDRLWDLMCRNSTQVR